MGGQDNVTMEGLYKLNDVQDRLRIYAQDKEHFKFWALRQKNNIAILKIISEKFGSVPASNVTDWIFRYPEFDEIEYQTYCGADSSTLHASNTILSIPNSFGTTLNTSSRLIVSGLWTKKIVLDAATDVKAVMVVAVAEVDSITLPEELRVVTIGAADSAGTGQRAVTVKRAHPTDSYLNPNSIPAITTTMQLTVSNLVSRSNDYPKPPITKNSKYLENNIQITRMSYGLGEHMTQGGGVDTYLANGSDAYFNIMYNLAETYLMKAIERAMLSARRSQKEIDGNLEFESGGIIEFIMADQDHILDFEGKVPTVGRINNFVRRMADTSGVKEIWLFTGTELSEQLANAYENKSIYYTQAELSVKYQLTVKRLESVGRDLVVYHVTAPILNELGMANEALGLNLTEMNYDEKHPFGCFQIAHKVPFGDYPDDAKSYKSNEGFKGRWRELYGAWGLVRRLPETHFRWINAAPPNQ